MFMKSPVLGALWAMSTLLLLVLSGCGAMNQPIGWNSETELFEPSVEIEISPVNIGLVPADPNRIDPFIGMNEPYDKVLTGGYWTKIFVGGDDADATLTLDSAQWSAKGGYTATYTYEVAGYVTCNNTKFPVFATGRGSSGWVILGAMEDALRAVVTEIAMKSESIASSCEQIDAPSDSSQSIETMHDELILLNDLLERGIITDSEFQEQKKKRSFKRHNN